MAQSRAVEAERKGCRSGREWRVAFEGEMKGGVWKKPAISVN